MMDDSTAGNNNNNPSDTNMMQGQDPFIEDAVFLDPNEAVEVKVDEENVPMEEEEEEAPVVVHQQQQDTSKLKFTSHSGQVYAVAACLNPDKSLMVVSGGGDDRAYVHHTGETATSTCLSHAHTDSVSCIAIRSNDNDKPMAAVGAYDGAIVLYDLETMNIITQLEGPSDVEWASFHPKGPVLLVGSIADGTVWMYHIPSKKCLQVFVGHESGVTCGGFSQDGRWALSGSSDGTLRVWQPKTGVSKHVFRFDNNEGLTCMTVGGGTDGQLVMVGTESGAAHVCHVGAKKTVASLRHYEVPPSAMQQQEDNDDDDEMMELPMSVEAVGFAPSNPNWCATGGVDGVLKIWDLTNDGGQCRQVCRVAVDGDENASNNNAGITHLQWHPTLPLVLACCADGAIRLWDARNGILVKTCTGHSDIINDMDVQFVEPNNNGGTAIVCTGSDDHSVRVFEIDIAAAMQSVAN